MDNGIRKRDISMDALRIVAAVAVILLHASAGYFNCPVSSAQWMVANVYNSATRWCVPVFVMISGAFLLQKEIPVKLLYTKYIKHLVVLLLSWNAIYNIPRLREFPSSLSDVVACFLSPGKIHLWFLYMLIGVYVAIPFLKKIVDGGLTKYLLCLWLVFGIALTGVDRGALFGERFFFLDYYVMRFSFSMNFVGYFVLGYYLYREAALSKKMRQLIYALGIIGYMGMVVGTYFLSLQRGGLHEFFYDNLFILNVFTSVAVFVLFRSTPPESFCRRNEPKMSRLITTCSDLSLGVYLIHLVPLRLSYHAVKFFGLHAVVEIPMRVLLTVPVCFFVIWLMRKISLLRFFVK